ncbi:MAG TPA: 16S rRNA (guanine(966)-N(2))-methyltransferase RsmD, partial [Kofleriaceae bacterium]|nr:16S rRNA (guanine(966)-N(2))-methyltransferase RsmD [Kofleriaceae bacterium]
MRIIAGSLGGRRLKAPPGDATRPTADRVREALFSILGPPPEGARVLDLCAGAGGLGLEALSRGAAAAEFVDSDRAALAALRANIDALGLGTASRVHAGDARSVLRRLAGPFHWVFADPPYRSGLADQMLAELGDGRLLAPDPVVVVEHDRRLPPAERHG